MTASAVAGYLFKSEYDKARNQTVCDIIDRVAMDEGCGFEPGFVVRFRDGEVREVLSQQLTPWYPV